jgi:putative membrane protein
MVGSTHNSNISSIFPWILLWWKVNLQGDTPVYLFFKYLHLISVIGWVSSTSSLGLYLIYKTLLKRDFYNQEEVRSFYRFLTVFEILFFLLVIIFGLLMIFYSGLGLDIAWIKYKIFIVFAFFLPLEIINGILVFKFVKNQKWYLIYDKFIVFISLPLLMAGLVVLYLAVFKPY